MLDLRNGTGTAGTRPHSKRRRTVELSDGGTVWLAKNPLGSVAGLNGGAVTLAQVQKVHLGHGVLGKPQWLAGAEHEPLDAHGGDQMGEVVLGRPPDPRDVPPHARLLGRGRPPVHLLDERA